ncbi:hypothetical protein ACSLGG_05345 [Bacillus mycoides]
MKKSKFKFTNLTTAATEGNFSPKQISLDGVTKKYTIPIVLEERD